MPINISLLRRFQWPTKSALDKNLKARANSKNPRETLTVFNQLPDLGNLAIHLGKFAKTAKGSDKAKPNPTIPEVNNIAPPSEDKDPANNEPKIGPVQEKETIANVKAIKNTPKIPPTLEALSALFVQDEGKVNSYSPKNEPAKKTRTTKKKMFNQILVEILFSISGSKESRKWKGKLKRPYIRTIKKPRK